MTKRIYQTDDNHWMHVSYTDNTAWLRNRTDGKDDERLDRQNVEQNDAFIELQKTSTVLTVKQVTTYLTEAHFDLDKLSTYENRDEWLEAFGILRQMADGGHEFALLEGGGQPGDANDLILIPQTRLRRFYQTLRIFGGIGITTQIVEYMNDRNRSERISRIIDESVRHFGRYQNVEEAFHGRPGGAHAVDEYVGEPEQFAKCLQARLRVAHNNGVAIDAIHNGNLAYVDYELSPYRTTNHATMEDGMVGVSGAGGLDLLLVDHSDGAPVPVIGEIKAATDRDLFLALIQSLMYAVELSSQSQLQRLRHHYGQFAGLADNSMVCIYLLFQGDTADVALYNQTVDLATQLFDHDGGVNNFVKSIKFVQVSLGPEMEDVIFKITDIVERAP